MNLNERHFVTLQLSETRNSPRTCGTRVSCADFRRFSLFLSASIRAAQLRVAKLRGQFFFKLSHPVCRDCENTVISIATFQTAEVLLIFKLCTPTGFHNCTNLLVGNRFPMTVFVRPLQGRPTLGTRQPRVSLR